VGRRIAAGILILLLAGLGVLGYFLHQNREKMVADPYRAVSPSAALIIETSDPGIFLGSVTGTGGIAGELSKIKEFGPLFSSLKSLYEISGKESMIKLFSGNRTIIAFYPGDQGELTPLLSMVLPSDLHLRQVKDGLVSAGIEGIVTLKKGKTNILGVPFTLNEGNDTLFMSVSSGLLLASLSPEMILMSQAQLLNPDDIRSAPGFKRVQEASGRNENKIFLVFENLKGVSGTMFRSEKQKLPEDIAKISGSAGGDFIIDANGFVFSGYSEGSGSDEILDRFRNIDPVILNSTGVLPASTAMFETVVLGREDNAAGNDAIPSATREMYGKLRPYIGDEVTRAYLDIRNVTPEESFLVIYELKNQVEAEQLFLEDNGNKRQVRWFEPDDQTRIPVYSADLKGFSLLACQSLAPDFNDLYFTFYDNFMVTGESFATVSRFLYENLLNKTLANDVLYREFETTLPSRASYYFYCVPSRLTEYLSQFFNDRIMNVISENKVSLAKIQAAGYQVAPSNEMIYNSLSLYYREEAIRESTTEWETLLDTIAAVKPFFFTNHNTGAREIFIQDLNNNAYLINAAGRVLWKVPLGERIMSSVFMVDYYRNGKYQLLFSGKNSLHLLDRNGNYVERYPVKLRSPATNSLAVFDYDDNRDYRLLIAGEDKLIYAYDMTGNVVKGWKPFRTAGIVSDEISFFRVSGKDYLLAADETAVYFLDRTGNVRLRPDETVTKARGSRLRLDNSSKPSVVCTSPDGSVNHIYFDGEVEKRSPGTFSVDLLFDFFDVDGDNFGEYIFIDKGVLYLYGSNLEELFTLELGSEKLGGPINFTFSSSDRRIGVYDIDKKLIYLIDRMGKVTEGFPLRGASMFSIGRFSDRSDWHLIVGGTDRFLYNYRINQEFIPTI